MTRLLAGALCFTIAVTLPACSLKKETTTSETNQSGQSASKEASTKPAATQPAAQTNPSELQPGQASGSFSVKGEVVDLKYAYAGRAERFGSQSMVILLTDKPIPSEAVAEELKSAPLLEGDKVRGLEYVIDDNGMWVRFHPSSYQESGTSKLKEYKVENDTVSGVDENDSSLSNEKYSRKVKFVAAIAK